MCEAHEIKRDLWPNFVKEARAAERHWLRLLPTYNKTSSGQHWKPTGSSCIDTIYTKQDSQDSIVKEKKRERERERERGSLLTTAVVACSFARPSLYFLFSPSSSVLLLPSLSRHSFPALIPHSQRDFPGNSFVVIYILAFVFFARSLSQIIMGLLFLGSVSIRLQFLPTIELS